MTDTTPGMAKEYRAVFANSQGLQCGWGPIRNNLGDALGDRPDRAEAPEDYVIGVQVRNVASWKPVPLSQILKEP